MKYYMTWREDYDDQWGWFTKENLEKEITRVTDLMKEDDSGETYIGIIIQGSDVTKNFIVEDYDGTPSNC